MQQCSMFTVEHMLSVKNSIKIICYSLLVVISKYITKLKLFRSSKKSSTYIRSIKMSTIVLAGLGLAAVGFLGKHVLRRMPTVTSQLNEVVQNLQKFDAESLANSRYYKGGFEQKMNRREAALILGVSPNAAKLKIKDAHKRIMLLNHPDRGGSPYIASKINEAKDFMDQQK